MPIQINEMIVRANIVEGNDRPKEQLQSNEGTANKDELIKECVALVMEMLNEKNAR